MKTEPYDLRIIRILEPLLEQIWVTSMLTVLNETQATLKRALAEKLLGELGFDARRETFTPPYHPHFA